MVPGQMRSRVPVSVSAVHSLVSPFVVVGRFYYDGEAMATWVQLGT